MVEQPVDMREQQVAAELGQRLDEVAADHFGRSGGEHVRGDKDA